MVSSLPEREEIAVLVFLLVPHGVVDIFVDHLRHNDREPELKQCLFWFLPYIPEIAVFSA